MVIYKGDFILSNDDKFVMKQLSSSSRGKFYNIDRDIYIEGLGKVSVKMRIGNLKGISIKINGAKIEETEMIDDKKIKLYEIISVYRLLIKVNGKEATLFLNVKLDEDDFLDINDYFLEELRILNYKVELNMTGDLLFYIQNSDLNYIINLIYCGFIIHSYKLIYPNSATSSLFEMAFNDKLERIGFIIPEETPDILKKIKFLVNTIEDSEEITPQDMVFVLLNTLPENSLSKPCVIENKNVLYSSIFSVIKSNHGIEHL